MTEKTYKTRIKEACQGVGTYKPEFDFVIGDLSRILEQRDKVWEQFNEKEKGQLTTTHTDKNGKTNKVKNPTFALWLELNTQALERWKELGLTPSALRKLNAAAMENKKESALMSLFKEVER